MKVKIYTPQVVEIPSEFLPALARRASSSLGDLASEIPATRGHLIRQAVQDGLLSELNGLITEDGTVDLVCDPSGETPLEVGERTMTLLELLDALKAPCRESEDTEAA